MCIIINEHNIFIHIPKCAGSSIKRLINSNKLNNPKLKNLSNKIEKGHWGIYPLIKNNIFSPNMKGHIVLRDPIEWYVSLYFYVKKFKNHPYFIYAKNDFKYFFNHLINMKNNLIDIDEHLSNHVNNKLGKKGIFCEYKPYDKLKKDVIDLKYIDNHPDFNILMSERNIDEGLYTYFVLFLISKINPLLLFSKTKENVLNNLNDYIHTNINIYSMTELDKLVTNLNFNFKNIHANKSSIKESYISYYDDEMLEKIKNHHEVFYKIKEIIK